MIPPYDAPIPGAEALWKYRGGDHPRNCGDRFYDICAGELWGFKIWHVLQTPPPSSITVAPVLRRAGTSSGPVLRRGQYFGWAGPAGLGRLGWAGPAGLGWLGCAGPWVSMGTVGVTATNNGIPRAPLALLLKMIPLSMFASFSVGVTVLPLV
eukprot:gene24502-biopygen22398